MSSDDVIDVPVATAERAVAEAARTEWGGTTLVGPEVAALPPFASASPYWADLVETHGTSALLMSANENPLGPSPEVQAAMQAALSDLHRFPDPRASRLRKALARHHDVDEETVVVGHGANELIERLVRTFVGPGETVVSGWPSYGVYRLVAHAAGREMLLAPLRDGRYDLGGLAALVDQRTKLVFIANPNNPTGTYVSHRSLAVFLERIPRSVIVVLDEAYAEFADAPDYPDSIRFSSLRPRFVVLRTFSKAYGLAGLRVGYGVMDPDLVRYLDRVRQAHNVSSLAQVGAIAALADQAHVQASRRLVRQGVQRLAKGLSDLGLVPWPSQTNFVAVKIPRQAELVVERLAEQGAYVRRLVGYEMPDTVRITVGKPTDNERVLSLLDDLRHLW